MPTKTAKKRKTNTEIYQSVTDRVVAALEEGTVPWEQGWVPQGGFFRNARTNRSYRGVNTLLLMVASLEKGYTSPFWLTFKQAKEMGGNIIREEGSTKVIFNSRIVSKTEMVVNPRTGLEEPKVFWMRKEWSIFNYAQTEGIPADKLPEIPKETKHAANRKAEAILKAMPKPARVATIKDFNPAYGPAMDVIYMPTKGQYIARDDYYSDRFHETIHSTGHSKRLGVKNIEDYERLEGHQFGSEDYSEEELRAQLGASFLSAICGLDTNKEQKRTAAYLHNWIGRLKAEPKLIYTAAQAAQRAVDYITNVKFEN